MNMDIWSHGRSHWLNNKARAQRVEDAQHDNQES